jgi:hypothetical protein
MSLTGKFESLATVVCLIFVSRMNVYAFRPLRRARDDAHHGPNEISAHEISAKESSAFTFSLVFGLAAFSARLKSGSVLTVEPDFGSFKSR